MPLLEITALAVGATLLVVARRQRVQARRQGRRVLRQALASPDPAVRRAAIQVAGDGGLSRSADVFLALVEREDNPSVLLALARIVVRNQWESAGDPAVLRLRLWAHRYVDQTRPQQEEPLFEGRRTREFQGPSAAEVVNLLLQPSHRRDRRSRPHRRSSRPPARRPMRPSPSEDHPWR